MRNPVLFLSLLTAVGACAADGAVDVPTPDDDLVPPGEGRGGDVSDSACPVRTEFRVVHNEKLIEGAYYPRPQPSPTSLERDGTCALFERAEREAQGYSPVTVSGSLRSVELFHDPDGRYLGGVDPGRPLVATMEHAFRVSSTGARPLARPPGPLAIHEHQPLAITWEESEGDDDAELVLRLDNVEHGEPVYLECVVPATDREVTVSAALVDELFELSRMKAGPHLERAVASVRQRGTARFEDEGGGCAVLDSEFRYELEQDMIPAGAMPGDD